MHKDRGYNILTIKNHPFSDNRGRIREHRLVMEKKLGRYLLPNEIVHHINRIKDDNRPENLRLFSGVAEHMVTEHPKPTQIYKYACENCLKEFMLTGKQNSTRGGRFCSYRCFNIWRTPKTPCKKEGCSLDIHARGLCNTHYRSLLRRLR